MRSRVRVGGLGLGRRTAAGTGTGRCVGGLGSSMVARATLTSSAAPGLPETEVRRMVAISSWIKDLFLPSNESQSIDDFNWKALKNKVN